MTDTRSDADGSTGAGPLMGRRAFFSRTLLAVGATTALLGLTGCPGGSGDGEEGDDGDDEGNQGDDD